MTFYKQARKVFRREMIDSVDSAYSPGSSTTFAGERIACSHLISHDMGCMSASFSMDERRHEYLQPAPGAVPEQRNVHPRSSGSSAGGCRGARPSNAAQPGSRRE